LLTTENNKKKKRAQKSEGKRMNRVIEVKSMHREREREKERETKDEKDNTSGDS
jgi:hypothetical protein